MTLFALIAFAIYWGTQKVVVHYVEEGYLSEENVQKRQTQYLENLCKYVADRSLSSYQTAEVARWVRMNPYIYVGLYRDGQLYFEAGYLSPQKNAEKAVEDRLETEGGRVLFPLPMQDRTVQVSFIDSTEYIYYSASYVAGIVVALLFFVVAMTVYFQSVTAKITRLARDVGKIGAGEIDRAESFRGKDEIALLSEDVNRMCDSLRENALKERQAMEANAGLITAMSHDLRTPLTVLMGYLDLIEAQEELSEDTKGYLQTCRSTAERLKTLSDDMFLYFYVFGTTQLKSSCAVYDASVLLDQILSEHMILLSEKNYLVSQQNVPEGATLYADPALLARVMDNLFSNFLKYADPAYPISVEFCLEKEQLRVRFCNRILAVRAAVESSGIGTKTCARMLKAMHATYQAMEDEQQGIYQTDLSFRTCAPEENGGYTR